VTIALHGSGISRGIALGAAHIVQRNALEVLEYAVAEPDVEGEVERLSAAVEEAKQGLRELRARIPPNTPADIAAFLDTHLLMLETPRSPMNPSGCYASAVVTRNGRSNCNVMRSSARLIA